jgi:hypothetical protein
VEILIRQGLSWDNSERIMGYIRASIGQADITPANLSMTDKTFKRWGLSGEKIAGIRKILALPVVTPQTLCSVKEGGIELVRMFKVLEGDDDDCWLYSDYNILRNLAVLLFRSKALTSRECMAIGRAWAGTRSQISYFLHRLKPEGAAKILEDEELEPWDFWGGPPAPRSASAAANHISAEGKGKDEVPNECPDALPIAD